MLFEREGVGTGSLDFTDVSKRKMQPFYVIDFFGGILLRTTVSMRPFRPFSGEEIPSAKIRLIRHGLVFALDRKTNQSGTT